MYILTIQFGKITRSTEYDSFEEAIEEIIKCFKENESFLGARIWDNNYDYLRFDPLGIY